MTTPAGSGSGRGPGVPETSGSARVSNVPATMSSGGPGPGAAAAAAAGQGGIPPVRHLRYDGVVPGARGGWVAHVRVDPEQGSWRTMGPFADMHTAALAHDRVAIAFLGDRARPNFKPAFFEIEEMFLRLCRANQNGDIDVCQLVANPRLYEARYAMFLTMVFRLDKWGQFLRFIIKFFMDGADQIGGDAVREGGVKLENRFVEMHRNKALDPRWRAEYIQTMLLENQWRWEQPPPPQQQQQGGAIAVQTQQQQGGAGSATAQQQQLWGGNTAAFQAQQQQHRWTGNAAAVQPSSSSSREGPAVPQPCTPSSSSAGPAMPPAAAVQPQQQQQQRGGAGSATAMQSQQQQQR